MISTKLLGLVIIVALFSGLAIVPAINMITPAFGENPHKDNPGDKDQGKGNDPPKKHHKNNGNN
jgi:hypothetical protein